MTQTIYIFYGNRRISANLTQYHDTVDVLLTFIVTSFVSLFLQLDILLNGNPVDALAVIVHKDKAYWTGKRICAKLKDTIHR